MDLNGGRLNGWSAHDRRSGLVFADTVVVGGASLSVSAVVETDRAVVSADAGDILEVQQRMNAGWGWWAIAV